MVVKCRLCDLPVLSDAEDRRLLMHLVVLGNSCEWAIIVRVKTIHAASEERTMYNASPNSGRCSVTTYSSVWEALPTERAQLARMKNGLWRDTHILANWRPSTRKVKNDVALGQRKRKIGTYVAFPLCKMHFIDVANQRIVTLCSVVGNIALVPSGGNWELQDINFTMRLLW